MHRTDYHFPKTASKAQVVRNLNTALRTAGYTFVYDSGDYGDFTVHRGKTWIAEEVSGSGNYRQTIMIEIQLTQEVVKLLQQDGKLKLYVVGHTDNVGPLAANMELSRQRAAAVVKELTTHYGIAGDRLQPFGDGPYAPVTSNDSEDGRTLNRRVELVKQ
jgi:hypothetical protein